MINLMDVSYKSKYQRVESGGGPCIRYLSLQRGLNGLN